MKSIAQYLTRQILLSGITLALFGAFIALAWTGPTAAPPNGNVAAPLNVGSKNQVKTGGLSVGGVEGGFAVNAGAYIQDNLSVGGNVTAAGYFHSSDVRLKDGVQTIGGLDLVEKLRGVIFTWKESGAPGIGVVAQEVEQVLPSAVHTDADGMKSVEYDQLIAPLIEAIKEQQAEIDSLKVEIEHLKK